MKSTRRTFLKTSLAASAFSTLASAPLGAAEPSAGRDYYDLRAYRLKPGAGHTLLDTYLAEALIPALNQRGISNVGVFTEVDVDKTAVTSTPKADSPVWVLIPHASLESFVTVSADINSDPAVQRAGASYLNVPKNSPAFDRIDTWLLRAFKSLPRIEVPAFAKSKAPGRIFELRDYESHSESRALSKMAMFDEGETEVMKDVGLSPVFFGQALAGPNLPHLRYLTGAGDFASHLANWKKFGADPRWDTMRQLPQYKDSVSKNTARFLVPTAFSQI
jgi:hypothetical protein